MASEKEILRNHEKVLKEEYLQVSYLDKFSLDDLNLPKVSVILPTFNRCPHSIEDDANPLGWCLESLLAQRAGGLDEIIIIDDCSLDYTSEVVKAFSDNSSIPIVHLKNSKNKGSSVSRNRGIEKSKNDLIMFLDDDCVFSRYMIFGANYIMNQLDDNIVALHLPIYHRKTIPFPIDMEKIGKLDLKTGAMDGNFGGFPIQYAENLKDSFLNLELKITKPFEIKNLGGVFLAKKHALQEIGGFPEDFSWRNNYREETEVSLRLADSGYKIFFTPDPKFHSIHLKYGAHGSEDLVRDLDRRIGRLITQSNVSLYNTGNRVDPEEWFFDRIISTYVILGRRDMGAANKYLEKTHQMFVVDNKVKVTGVKTRIEDYEKREVIFKKAVEEGNKLIGQPV